MAELEIDINMRIREWDVIQVTVFDDFDDNPSKYTFLIFSFETLWFISFVVRFSDLRDKE